MITDRQEYEHAKTQLAEQRRRMDLQRKRYVSEGFSNEDVERAMQPVECFYMGKLEEVEAYEAGLETR